MGFIGDYIAPAFGAGIGSIWGKEKEGADIGRSIGKIIPFEKGGMPKVYKRSSSGIHPGFQIPPVANLYAGPISNYAAGGIPRERPAPQPKRRGGRMKKNKK